MSFWQNLNGIVLPYDAQNDGVRITQKKGGSISFGNPFLLCPINVKLGIRTQTVLGTPLTNFHFRFLLHRGKYYIVVFCSLFFYNQLFLIEYDQNSLKLRNLINFWAWGPTWPLLNPNLDPGVRTQPQKWVQLCVIS